MTNKMGLGNARGVQQRHDIGDSRGGSIVPAPRGSRGSGVTALTRSERSEPCRVQPTRDRLEAGRLLWESVQQHDNRCVRRSRVDNVESQAGAYEVVHDSPPNHRSAALKLELCTASLRTA